MIAADIVVDTSIKAKFAAKSCEYDVSLYTLTVYHCAKSMTIIIGEAVVV